MTRRVITATPSAVVDVLRDPRGQVAIDRPVGTYDVTVTITVFEPDGRVPRHP